MIRFLFWGIILSSVMTSCNSDPFGSHWNGVETFTICQYLKANQEEYSKSYRLLQEGKLLSTLCGYNPHGEGYTLFLPTDEAIDRFIGENPDYRNFEELLQDTSFTQAFARYHTVNKKLHTDDFPDGALTDMTLNGERLTTGFYTDGNDLLIKVNNSAPIIQFNLEMTNGYIHVISEVLQKVKISGYDWLQQQEGYSILAQAMEFCRIKNTLRFDKYTILAEHDSVYHRNGIMNLEDLINRIAGAGGSGSSKTGSLYNFAAYHILSGEFYLNDLHWGKKGYWTLATKPLIIIVGQEIQINPGIEIYDIVISESGDTTVVDYILPIWESSNRITNTGPVHSISDLMHFKPIP